MAVELMGLSILQILSLVGLALVAVVVILLALRIITRIGGAILKIGCVLLTLIFLAVGAYLSWLVLT